MIILVKALKQLNTFKYISVKCFVLILNTRIEYTPKKLNINVMESNLGIGTR